MDGRGENTFDDSRLAGVFAGINDFARGNSGDRGAQRSECRVAEVVQCCFEICNVHWPRSRGLKPTATRFEARATIKSII